MTTPDFPAFAARFAQQLSQLRTTLGPSLHQFEALCAAWIPRHLLAQQDEGPLWRVSMNAEEFILVFVQGGRCRAARCLGCGSWGLGVKERRTRWGTAVPQTPWDLSL